MTHSHGIWRVFFILGVAWVARDVHIYRWWVMIKIHIKIEKDNTWCRDKNHIFTYPPLVHVFPAKPKTPSSHHIYMEFNYINILFQIIILYMFLFTPISIYIYLYKSKYACIRNDPPKKQTRSCWQCLLNFIPTSRSTGHCRSESFSRRCGSLRGIYRDNLENKTKGGVYIYINKNQSSQSYII